jgi:hypothetical protein
MSPKDSDCVSAWVIPGVVGFKSCDSSNSTLGMELSQGHECSGNKDFDRDGPWEAKVRWEQMGSK